MKNTTMYFFLTVVICFSVFGAYEKKLVSAEITSIKYAGFNNRWFDDWDDGIEAAKKEKKPVLIDFMSDHCGGCAEMDKQTFAAPEIKERLIPGWICIKVNTHHSGEKGSFNGKTMNYYKLSKYFRVKAVPTFVFLDTDSKPVQSIVGFRNKEIFGPILDYMKDEAYKKGISFKEYKKNSGKVSKRVREKVRKRGRE